MRDLRPALWIFAVLACAPLVAKLGAETYLLSLATHALIFAIAALSLDFVLGHGALVSFGHAAFLGIGAYAVAMLSRWGHDEIVVQLLAAISAAAVFALATGAISLRASGVYYIMSTLAFGQMLYFFFVSLSAWGGDDGVTLDARSRLFGASVLKSDVGLYYFALVVLMACWALAERIVGSRFGRVLGAIRQNPLRVRAVGFQPFGYRLTAYAISGAMCATAGVLLANQSEFVSPAFMTWQRSGELLVMVILGGVGSLWGAILGAIAFLALEESALRTDRPRQSDPRSAAGAHRPDRADRSGRPRGAKRRRGRAMTAPLLVVEGLCKRFGALLANDEITFEAHPCELHALIGPNGAGKTTLINQLSGAVPSDGGRIVFEGEDITRLDMTERSRRGLARTFQTASLLPDYTALANVALAAQARSGSSFRFFGRVAGENALNAVAGAALARVGLAGRASFRAGALSHGEQRLLEIAVALACAPKLLLLDEPFAGLGPEESKACIELIRELKREFTILLVEHDMDAVFSLADRVSVLVDGRILATGSPMDIRADERVRAAYLGDEEFA